MLVMRCRWFCLLKTQAWGWNSPLRWRWRISLWRQGLLATDRRMGQLGGNRCWVYGDGSGLGRNGWFWLVKFWGVATPVSGSTYMIFVGPFFLTCQVRVVKYYISLVCAARPQPRASFVQCFFRISFVFHLLTFLSDICPDILSEIPVDISFDSLYISDGAAVSTSTVWTNQNISITCRRILAKCNILVGGVFGSLLSPLSKPKWYATCGIRVHEDV